jgi:hypothetical protein
MNHTELLAIQSKLLVQDKISEALAIEKKLGYMVESGRYWESETEFDKDALKAIDAVWLSAINSAA